MIESVKRVSASASELCNSLGLTIGEVEIHLPSRGNNFSREVKALIEEMKEKLHEADMASGECCDRLYEALEIYRKILTYMVPQEPK